VKLYEHMAKEVFSRHGIPVPPGRVATTPGEAEEAARKLGPVAVKAQVLAGGRGKAGGVGLADSPEEARSAAERILGMTIKGNRVEKVLVEKKLKIDAELYLGITIDGSSRRPVFIASASGGVDIEEVPEGKIVRRTIDITWGLQAFEARDVVGRMGLRGAVARRAVDVALKLYGVFRDCDAELTEINPLVISGEQVIAADARLNVDDDALFRQKDVPRTESGTELERRVSEMGLSYVQLDGDIAVMANGAGITMATMDTLARYGGRPANFLDAGGGAGAEPMAKAISVLLSTSPRAMLINIFGGITRCDDVANALISVKEGGGIPVPLVVRLVGTNEEQGIALLKEHGIQAFRSMDEAAARAVELVRGGE